MVGICSHDWTEWAAVGTVRIEWRRHCVNCGQSQTQTARPEPNDRRAAEDDESASAREHAAEARDQRAETRDHMASARDAEADTRDQAGGDVAWFDRRTATSRDAEADQVPPVDYLSVRDRTAAFWDRGDAKSDRAEAAADRRAAADDRDAAAQDRSAASLDELTGARRRGPGLVELERDVARARRTGQGLVFAFVDVNGLKAINDTRGHAAGDQVLREVVATLRTKLRSYDLIIRLGGDEFLCAIPGVDIDEVAERLASVNAALAASPEHASVTTGLAGLQASDSAQDLIARADGALYQTAQPTATYRPHRRPLTGRLTVTR